MKWIKAVKQIENALAAGKAVSVRYHRKWMTNFTHVDKVDCISKYIWDHERKSAVNTYHNQLLESTHIIDEVIITER